MGRQVSMPRAGQAPHQDMVGYRRTEAPLGVEQPGSDRTAPTEVKVYFSSCKGETHTHKNGYRQLFRRLRSSCKTERLESVDDLNLETLSQASVLVFPCPREKFSTTEFDILKKYIGRGGSLLVLLHEGGESKLGTNINYLLEEYGISVNSDALIRTAHYKYFHPKEVLISDGVLNRSLIAANSSRGTTIQDDILTRTSRHQKFDGTGLDVVYPYGATLSVQKPAVPLLSSGKIAYPMQRPLCAVWSQKGQGKIAVLGAVQMFDDQWLTKENNAKLFDFLLSWLKPGEEVQLHPEDADDPEISDVQLLPDTQSLSDKIKCCLEEDDDLPADFTSMFDCNLFKFDTSLVPEAVALYRQLAVKKGPLTLIAPTFETPLPPLQPAVFPPAIREPPPPALELFDLEENFASEQIRLAHLTNRCSGDEDMDYYIVEAASILGLPVKEDTTAKSVLAEVFQRIVRYKMAGIVSGAMEPSSPGPWSARAEGPDDQLEQYEM